MTGWRLGYAHGPGRLIQEMAKLQQFSYVCAPSIVQKAGVVALDQDLTAQVDAYRRKRDAVLAALGGLYEIASPGRRLLRLPPGPLGHRDRVRRRGDPPVAPDHPRQRLQPPRHPLPDLLRRRRRHPRPGARSPQGARPRPPLSRRSTPGRASASSATNAACSGVASPRSSAAISPSRSSSNSAFGSSQRPGKTSDR